MFELGENTINSGGVPIHITHRDATSPGNLPDGCLLLSEPEENPNTLTRIEIPQAAGPICYHWHRFVSAHSIHALYVPATHILFIGGGTYSAAIDCKDLRIVRAHKVLLFWSYEWRREFVLELSEMECFLHREDGNCVARVPVDPPYEIHEEPDALRFESPVFGTHRMTFPNPDTSPGVRQGSPQ